MKKTLCLLLLTSSTFIFSQIIRNYTVDGISRKAILYEPSVKSDRTPVIFVFHGHGGNAKFASRRMTIQDYYRDALIIFMEGLPGRKVPALDPNGTMNGWQVFTDDLGKRDIHFYDAVFSDIHRDYNVDDGRIYLLGHSNGARFVNVLWKERGHQITAICSASGQGGNLIIGAVPVSVWMSMGKNDKIVSFESQQRSIPLVKSNLGIKEAGKTEGDHTIFLGKDKTELVLQQSNAGHEFPQESLPQIAQFFKRHSK